MNERYSRQILFAPIGIEGQKKIASKHVLIIGAGALGSPNAEMLVRSGIGKLTIIDRDYVEASNLQRQLLYTEEDAINKMPKASAAANRLRKVNSDVVINEMIADATMELLESIIHDVDLIIDATDNFETRMLINDISQKHQIPWIYGACVGSYGMSFTIIPKKTPCLHCLIKRIPLQGLTCDTGGIISPAAMMTVTHQVTESLKILVEDTENIRQTFVSFDLWKNQYNQMKVTKAYDPTCLSCGEHPTYPFLQPETMTKTAVLCGRDSVQVRPSKPLELDLNTLAIQLQNLDYEVKSNPFLVSAQKEDKRIVFFKDGRALIHGTKDMVSAKTLYQQLLG